MRGWSVAQAIRAAKALQRYDVLWLEVCHGMPPLVCVPSDQPQVLNPSFSISPTFPFFYHDYKNRRRNEQKCMAISVTASVLITK
eukprot:COSAG01_NODE_18527_length_1070_cov_1.032956_1_plen_85_part_00